VILAAALATAAAALAPAHACRFHGARTLAGDRAGLVFRLTTRDDETWYGGCLHRDGVPRFVDFEGLDVEGVEDVLDDLRLAGPYVATADDVLTDPGASYGSVTVADLRRVGPASPLADGSPLRFHRSARIVTHGVATTAHHDHDRVRALVLARSGAVAWIGQDLVAGLYEVRARHGHRRALLARGADIDPGSLRLQGSEVSWTQAGAARSAALP
jgi:hypothetical protein